MSDWHNFVDMDGEMGCSSCFLPEDFYLDNPQVIPCVPWGCHEILEDLFKGGDKYSPPLYMVIKTELYFRLLTAHKCDSCVYLRHENFHFGHPLGHQLLSNQGEI